MEVINFVNLETTEKINSGLLNIQQARVSEYKSIISKTANGDNMKTVVNNNVPHVNEFNTSYQKAFGYRKYISK